jgi:hypothetical protein
LTTEYDRFFYQTMEAVTADAVSAISGGSTAGTSANVDARSRGGRGGQGNRGGRGGHGHNRYNPRNVPLFKGNTEAMNGHVFQCFSERNDKKQFARTEEALGEYIAKTLKFPGDLMPLTRDLVTPIITTPDDLDEKETNRLKIALWEKEVSNYVLRCDYLDSNCTPLFGANAARHDFA